MNRASMRVMATNVRRQGVYQRAVLDCANAFPTASHSLRREGMTEVEVRLVACTECGGTGKCPACGGSGRGGAGGVCPACDDGTCYFCWGTTTEERYFYGGRRLSGFSSYWRRFMATGLFGLATGAYSGIVLLVRPPPEEWYWRYVGGVVVGLVLGPLVFLWSVGLWKQDHAYRRLHPRAQRRVRR